MKFYIAILEDGTPSSKIHANENRFPQTASVQEFNDLDAAMRYLIDQLGVTEVEVQYSAEST